MWTEQRKQIGPIAAREKAAAPASEKNRSAAPAGQKKWGVPLGQAPFRRGTLKPGGIPYAGMSGAKNGREGGATCRLSCWG